MSPSCNPELQGFTRQWAALTSPSCNKFLQHHQQTAKGHSILSHKTRTTKSTALSTSIFRLGLNTATCYNASAHKGWHVLKTIIGRSCHKYHVCRDKSFVMMNTCLRKHLLSRQKYACHDKTLCFKSSSQNVLENFRIKMILKYTEPSLWPELHSQLAIKFKKTNDLHTWSCSWVPFKLILLVLTFYF